MTDIQTYKCYMAEKARISHNIEKLKQRTPGGRIYAVLKANGYGLGCAEMAAICAENGLSCFAVSETKDAEKIISSGVPVRELLLLSSARPCEIPALAAMGVTFTVASSADAENLKDIHATAHIKVDTGMGRRGFRWNDPKAMESIYKKYPNIRFTGIYTHFADGANPRRTKKQFKRFQNPLSFLESRGINPGIRHCCSSTSAFRYDHMLLDGIRTGSALLGRIQKSAEFGLERTGICRVDVESVRRLPKGTPVGYGGIFRTRRETVVALCPIGTHNGFGVTGQPGLERPLAALSESARRIFQLLRGGNVPFGVINGCKCKVLGRICSESVILDVTDIPCQPGDKAYFDINPLYLNDIPVEFV